MRCYTHDASIVGLHLINFSKIQRKRYFFITMKLSIFCVISSFFKSYAFLTLKRPMLLLKVVNYRERERGGGGKYDRKEIQIDNGPRYNKLADKHP